MSVQKVNPDFAWPAGVTESEDEFDAREWKEWRRTLMRQIVSYSSLVTSSLNAVIGGNFTTIQLEVSFSAPIGPADGMIAFADGTEWNPGSGRGFYGYVNGAWQSI